MGLRARAHPWAVGWKWGVGGGGRDELMGGLTKRTVRTEGNGLETNVQAFVLDDAAGASVFSSGVRVGAGGTHLTRQGWNRRVDGGVSDADVKDSRAAVE